MRHLFVCALLASIPLLLQCQQEAPYGPVPGVDVRHYAVTLRLDPEARAVEGRAVLHLRHADSLRALPLAFAPLTVEAVRVNGAEVEAKHRAGRLVVPLSAGADSSTVEIRYRGVPKEGLYAGQYGGQEVVYTDAWPYRGRGWLPAVHHPADPATLDLTLRVPLGYEAAASGTLQRLDTLDGDARYRWRLDVPAPTYAYAFAITDFDEVAASATENLSADAASDGLPVRYYLLSEDAAQDLRRTPQALDVFSELLGPYPFDTYAVVQVPLGFAGMENAAAPFVQAGLFEQDRAEAVQVHEAAHQWFGNRVVIAGWRDLWLSEGTATYLTTWFYEQVEGAAAAHRRRTALATLTEDRRRSHHALVPPPPVFPQAHLTWVPYDKGACVLHTLRLKLGDGAFFAALRRTYRRYAGRPLSTEAFRAVLEDEAGTDLQPFFAYWVYGTSLPTLHTTWEPNGRRLRWTVDGDAGTLEDVPFLLEITQGDRTRYEPVETRDVTLLGWRAEPPVVRPVGVMMRVEG